MPDDRLTETDFQRLIDTLPELVWVSNSDRECVYCNRQWLDFTGRSLAQALGHGWFDNLHADDRARFETDYAEAFAARREFALECRLRRADGDYRWILNSGRPWFAADGRFAGYVGSAVDISERRQAAEERERLQRQLQQAQKMEAIGHLTGGIAHDFNNILASIIGYTGLALTRFVPDRDSKLARYLQEVHTAGERARDLINQMLAFSRGAGNASSLHRLEPLVGEAMKLLQSTLPSSIELTAHLEGDSPPVMIDPVQFQQVVINLCINARDALDGRGHLDLRVQRRRGASVVCASCHARAQGDFVELVVKDNGRGMDADVMGRMFDPFFSAQEPAGGSGMGLSIVHGIVHEHGGHIEVESAPGQGSAFRLLFPAVHIAERPQMHEPWPDSAADAGSGGGQRILVVDDEASVAGFIGELLDSRGYSVQVLTDCNSVLRHFGQDPDAFDLVVMDQTMPGMTGIELADVLLGMRAGLPIILCTGYSDAVDEAVATAHGIRGFLAKPISVRVLLDKVRQLLLQRVCAEAQSAGGDG